MFNENDELIKLRRHFHRHPELSLEEHETSKYILSYLRALDPSLIIKSGIAGTGLTALLIGEGGDGPCIGLRADMDALPVQELHTDSSYISTVDGVSHCCGHDTHMAIMLVTAKLCCSMKSQLCGSIKFIFQPAEEDKGGAERMVKEGALDNPTVDQIYGLHILSLNPLGTIRINKKPKPFMSGCATFYIELVGTGGHGAMPQHANDPVIAAASLLQQIHTIVSRNISPRDMGVVGVGSIQCGNKDNVIPSTATMSGTMRWFEDSVEKVLKHRLQSVCDGIAKSFEVEVHLRYDETVYPAVFNDPSPWEVVCNAAERVVGDGLDKDAVSSTASEDFSFFLHQRPGAFFFLGGKVDDGEVHPHHSPEFKIDERSLVIGVQTFVNIVSDLLVKKERWLSKL